MSDSDTQQSDDAPSPEPDDSPVEYPAGTIGWLEAEWRRREEANADFADLYAIPGVSLLQEVALLWWGEQLSPRRLSNLVRELAFTIGGSDADWHLLPIDQAAAHLWARRENQEPGKLPTVDPEEFRKALERVHEQAKWAGTKSDQPEPRKPTGDSGGTKGGEGAAALTSEEWAKIFENLPPAARKAYLAFQYAQTKVGTRLKDPEAYDLLKEEGIPEDKGNAGELTDYELPNFDSWTKNLRNARGPLKEQKYTPRGGRQKGRSIVRTDEIEQQKRDAD